MMKGELDPEMVKEGRREEVEFMVEKLDMFEFGTLEEAMRRGGNAPRRRNGRKDGRRMYMVRCL